MDPAGQKIASSVAATPHTPPSEEISLPIAPVELQAAMAAVYHAALDGVSRSELVEMICIELAKRLSVPLVMLVRKSANGAITIEGTSPNGALCLAFHRTSLDRLGISLIARGRWSRVTCGSTLAGPIEG